MWVLAEEKSLPWWAVRLRAERDRRGWNKHEMARRLHRATGRTLLGVAAAAGLPQGRRVLQALDLIAGCHLDAIADSLRGLIEHYALAVRFMPPADVYDELIAVRPHVDGILKSNKTARRYKDISLPSGWLSSLLAIAACELGKHATARIWCADAERRSRDSDIRSRPHGAADAGDDRFHQRQPHYTAGLAARGQRLVRAGT